MSLPKSAVFNQCIGISILLDHDTCFPRYTDRHANQAMGPLMPAMILVLILLCCAGSALGSPSWVRSITPSNTRDNVISRAHVSKQ